MLFQYPELYEAREMPRDNKKFFWKAFFKTVLVLKKAITIRETKLSKDKIKLFA